MRIAVLFLIAVALCSAATVEFIGPSTQTNDGVDYVGPYDLIVDGLHIQGVCLDYDIRVASVWTANWVPLTSITQPERTAYLEAAWIDSQFPVTSTNEWVAMHHGIWDLFGASYSDGAAWDTLAAKNYGLINPVSFMLLDAVPEGSSQDFLVQTPEPANWVMAVLGLMVLGVGSIKRKWYV